MGRKRPTNVLREMGRKRPTNVLEDMLYGDSDWSRSSSSVASSSSRSSIGSGLDDWNYHSDYSAVPTTELPDYMRLKRISYKPLYQPMDVPVTKLANLSRKVGRYDLMEHNVLPKVFDELPKIARNFNPSVEYKMIEKLFPDFFLGAAVDDQIDKKKVRSSKRSKRLGRKRFSR